MINVVRKIIFIALAFSLPLFAQTPGTLTAVEDSLSSYASGASVLHRVSFTMSATGNGGVSGLPLDGKIRLVFPTGAGYNLLTNLAIMAENGSILDGGFLAPVAAGDSITWTRDATGTDVAASTEIVIWLALIGNPSARRLNDQIIVRTVDNGNFIIDSGVSAPYHIDGPISSYKMTVSGLSYQIAGVAFQLNISDALDVYGHPATDSVLVTAASGANPAPDGTLPILNNIYVRNGIGSATQVLFKKENNVKLQGRSKTLNIAPSPEPASFSVWHNTAIAKLIISGEPTTIVSGVAFTNPIKVTVLDPYGNLADSYAKWVTFGVTLTDGNATFPAPYKFETVDTDNGQHSFSGSEFNLFKAGTQRIWVKESGGTLADTTEAITVTASAITNFSIVVNSGNAVTAGTEFPITVTGAVDASGNPASGTISLTFADGLDHKAPNGVSPILVPIPVVNGVGSANSKLVKTEPQFQLQTVGYTIKTGSILVLPATAAELQISGKPAFPDTLLAGQTFGGDSVYVRVVDSYGNLQNNYSGSVYFTSSDNQAIVPYTAGSQKAIPLGEFKFPGSGFTLKTAGNHTLTVHSGALSKTSPSVLVKSTVITSFTLSVASTQIAGIQFPLTVTNAKDSYGNLTNGVIIVTATTGGNNAPNNNASAILTNIPVANGQGSAAQVLVRCEAVILRGAVQGNPGATPQTVTITVNPGLISYFEMSGTPTRIAAGSYFPAGTIVKAFDAFGNLKTNYTGTIIFSSTDAAAYFPGPYTFAAGELGVHQFTGTNQFRMSTPGIQTLIVRDNAVTTALGQKSIEVSSLIITRVYSDNATVSRGQQNALVKMDVLNSATKALSNLTAGLSFTNSTISYSDDYTVLRKDNVTTIAAGATATLEFQVAVMDDASLLNMTLNGTATGKVDTMVVTDSDGASSTDSWLVQSAARLQITSITVGAETINQGQAGVIVTCLVSNIGKATANISSTGLEFLLNNATNVASSFSVVPFNDNVSVLAGEQSATLRYYITASNTASTGLIYVYQNINYTDANSTIASSLRSTVYDTFTCAAANVLTITEITPSRTTVTAGQTAEWAVYVGVKNAGDSPIILSFSNTKTYIRIRKTTNDYTSTYTITQPTTFEDGTTSLNGGATKRIRFGIPKTGPDLGVMTLLAYVEATDGTKAADASGSIEVQAVANVHINKIIPSQSAVTVNDVGYEWKIAVVVENSGGSEVSLSFDSLYTNLVQTPKILKLVRPTGLQRYGASLKGGQSDTLLYKVTSTANTTATQLLLDAQVRYTVVNTNEVKTVASTLDGRGVVNLQMPSNFVINRVRISRKPVTQGRTNWWVTVVVSNQAGGSDVSINLADSSKTYVQLRDAVGQPVDYYFNLPGGLAAAGSRVLAAGKTDSLIFPIKSAGIKTGAMTAISQVTAVETNRTKTITQMATGVLADNVTIQTKAQLGFRANSLMPTYASPGETVRYQVTVINSGSSAVVLDPVGTKIEFSGGINTYSARLDPAFGYTLNGSSETTIAFNMNQIAETFAPGAYMPSITFKGIENGTAYERLIIYSSGTTVGAAKTLSIQSMTSGTTSSITAGQEKDWKIIMTLANNGNNTLRLSGSQLTFYLNDADISSKFGWTTPVVFTNSSVFLRGKSTQTLEFPITSVSATTPVGRVMVSGKITMTDSAQSAVTYSEKTENTNSAYVTVETPAVLQLTKIHVSQPRVTRGQSSWWNIRVGVKNVGGSTVEVQPTIGNSTITFSKGSANFDLQSPTAFISGAGLQLTGGKEDSLLYTVKKVNASSAVLGNCDIAAVIKALELNSDRSLQTQNALTATVVVQDSARVRIDTLIVDLPADSTVNSGQQYYFKARVSNVGNGETVRALYVQLFSKEGLSTFPLTNGERARIDTLAAGQSKWTTPGFLVQAKNVDMGYMTEHFHSRIIETLSDNTGGSVQVLPALQSADTSKTIRNEKPGLLEITQIIPSVDSVSINSYVPFYLRVIIRNSGQSTLLLQTPAKDDIEVSLNGYTIQPPLPTADELRLIGGEIDTLIYTVASTGASSGIVVFTAKLKATDENDPTRTLPTATMQKNLKVVSNSRVYITSTFVAAEANHRVDASGVVHVNTGQNFRIGVGVKNDGGQDLQNIKIGLKAVSSTLINGAERMINSLPIASDPDTVYFDIKAAAIENLSGEQFTAMINDAKAVDNSKARVLPAVDSTAVAKIYNEAILQITSVRNLAPNSSRHVSFGQIFQVEAIVKNLGSEPVKDVKLRLDVPPDSVGKVSFDSQILSVPGEITANDTAKAVFTVTASSRFGQIDLIASVNNSTGRNSNQPALVQHEGENNTTKAFLEKGAQLQMLEVYSSVAEVNAGDKSNTWRINVVLVNNGQSTLQLTEIKSANITVTTEGEVDDNYKITPGSLLHNSGLRLPGNGVPDTLEYFVSQTGDRAGRAEIEARVAGFDVNLSSQVNPEIVQWTSGQDTISVNSQSWVRIDLAAAKGRQRDASLNWLVNRAQIFEALVTVETGELGGVDSVWVELTSNGSSIIEPAMLLVPRLNSASKDTVVFTVTADDSWSQKLAEKKELLTAKILSAKTLGTALAAQIKPPRQESDAQISMRIQNPAKLSLDLSLKAAQDSILTIDQVFVLKARITNLGSAPVDEGQISLQLPAGFQTANSDVLLKNFLFTNEAGVVEDSFQVKAPSYDLIRATLQCRISTVPNDLNRGLPATLVNNGVDSLRVTVARSGLILSNSKINSPIGATLGIVSTLQYFTMQTKIEATVNLKNVKVKLEMPSGKGYSFNAETPLEREISAFPSTIQWTVRAPDKKIGEQHKFYILATGQSDLGMKSTRDSIQINNVVTRAQLRLEELTVSSPIEARKDPGGVFSTGQSATLTTKITNNGEASVGTGKVLIDFGSSGFTLAGGETFEKTFSVGTDIYWNVLAPSTAVTATRTIEIRLSYIPVDEHTGLSADLFGNISNDYLYVVTNEAGSISIPSAPTITAPAGAVDKILSTGQEFQVTAEITSARVTDQVTAKLVFSNKEYKIDMETKKVAIGAKQKVQWTVVAPATATIRPDTFYVYASGYDASSPTMTRSALSAKSLLTVQNKTVFSMRAMIWSPDSTYQNVVSTDEEFVIKTLISSEGAPFNTTDAYVVQMSKPVEFTTTDTLQQTRVNSNPYWTLRAPTKKPEGLFTFRFLLKDVPRDLNSNMDGAIKNAEVDYTIQVRRRAEAVVVASLSDTAVTTYAPVRIGSKFFVKAYLNNLGDAGFVGWPLLDLDLPEGYQRKSKTGTDTLTWEVQAPSTMSNQPDTLKIKLLTPYPKDQYSKKTALIKSDSARVIVKREAGMLVFRPTSKKINSTKIKGANQISVLSFSLANKDISLNSRSLLDTLQIRFKNKRGENINASDVVTKISALRPADNQLLAELTEPPASSLATLNFTTLHADTIKDTDEYHVAVLLDLKGDPAALDFQVTLDSAKYIIARDAFSFNRLLLADSSAQQIQAVNFSSGSVVFIDPAFDKSFCNYPNPFGTSARPLTKFVYYLPEASDIKLKIFTLTGDLVYTWDYTVAENSRQTSAGLHDGDIVWNGRNGRGQKVMNGVYLAYLQVANGGQALTKIAVIR